MVLKAEQKKSDIVEIAKGCAQVLHDKKAMDFICLDLREVNSYLDYFLIVTGNSTIHCKSLAKELRKYLTSQELKERGRPDLNSQWIVLDYNELVVHIFTEDVRAYYQLEKIWADAEIIELIVRVATSPGLLKLQPPA